MPPVNPYNKYIKQYQTSNINTATPEKLMILLFDGALQFLQKAKTAISENNLQERAKNIEGARKIIRELMRTIDLENGIEVGKHLFVFYDKLVKMLYKVNRKRDLDMLEEVINELKTLRSAFLGAIDIAAKEKSGSLIDSDTEA